MSFFFFLPRTCNKITSSRSTFNVKRIHASGYSTSVAIDSSSSSRREGKIDSAERTAAVKKASSSSPHVIRPFHEIPGPKGLPLIGNVWRYLPLIGEYRADRLDETGRINLAKYGPIVREHVFGDLNIVHLFDPKDMETLFRSDSKYPERRSHRAIGEYRRARPSTYSSGGIFCENGPEWYRLRKISQQALLNPNNVKSFIPETEVVTNELVHLIRSERNSQLEMLDFQYDLYKWSLENISYITMDTRLGCLSPNLPEDCDARKLIKAAHLVIEAVMETEIASTDIWKYFPTKMYRQLCSNEDVMSNIVTKYLTAKKHDLDNRRQLNSGEQNQVVQRQQQLLATNSGDSDAMTVLESFFDESNKKVTFGDVLATVLDLMLAGIDTTAFSSGFVLYYLAINQSVQDKLRQEIRSFFPTVGDSITAEKLDEMTYLKACVKESMRLMPLSVGIGRVTTTPIVVRNYSIPASTMVVTQNQVACRLPEYFESPNDFIPERWLNLRSSKAKYPKPHPFLALPFGYGPRSCPGRRISDMNTYVLLIKLLSNFNIEYHHDEIGVVTRLINIPDKPMQFKFIDL